VGRPLFGGGAPLADNQSWERQVENQKTWEEQVASYVEQLDGQPPASAGANAIVPPASGIGSTDAGVGVASLPAPSQDPIGDFDAWEEQIISHAQPMITRGDSPAAVESSAPTAGLPGMPSPEGVPPGEAAWSARETKTTVHALDVDEDGRLDDDGDGRFETLPASPPVLPKEQIDTPGSGP
jgi:hypothetical protein